MSKREKQLNDIILKAIAKSHKRAGKYIPESKTIMVRYAFDKERAGYSTGKTTENKMTMYLSPKMKQDFLAGRISKKQVASYVAGFSLHEIAEKGLTHRILTRNEKVFMPHRVMAVNFPHIGFAARALVEKKHPLRNPKEVEEHIGGFFDKRKREFKNLDVYAKFSKKIEQSLVKKFPKENEMTMKLRILPEVSKRIGFVDGIEHAMIRNMVTFQDIYSKMNRKSRDRFLRHILEKNTSARWKIAMAGAKEAASKSYLEKMGKRSKMRRR